MTTASWTIQGAEDPAVHRGYKAYHKSNYADPQFSRQNNQRGVSSHVIQQDGPNANNKNSRDMPKDLISGQLLEATNIDTKQPIPPLHPTNEAFSPTANPSQNGKRKDLDMLRSYDPWGKPAVGAPRFTPKGDIDARRNTNYESARPAEGAEGLHGAFGRPGGGAPLRTDSGRVQVVLRADADLRFQKQLKKEVDASLRYKQLEGRSTPAEHSVVRTESEKDRIVEESKKRTLYAKKLEQQLAEQIKREAQEAIQAKAPIPIYFPWGRDKPQRDESGKIAGRKQAPTTPYEKQSRPLPNPEEASTKPPSLYDPWGRPGAGAPLRDGQGQPKATLHGTILREQMNAQHLLVGSGNRQDQTRETPRAVKRDTADVDHHSQKHQYYIELLEQAEQRQERLKQQREKERKTDHDHLNTAIHFLDNTCTSPHNQVRRSWKDQEDLEKEKKKREYCIELQRSIAEKEQQRQEARHREKELEKKATGTIDYIKRLAASK